MVNIAFLFAIVLSITHYLSESFHLHKNKDKIVSFGAGVMLAYLILDLFPQVFLAIGFLKKTLFIYILIGFSLFHLTEKYIYQHASKKVKLKELKEAHSIAFFIYYLIIGIIIFNLTQESTLQGILVTIPLIFHTTISAVSLNEIHHSIKQKSSIKLLLSSSPVIGVLLARFIYIPPVIDYALLAFISGALLYIITREVIPKESKGNPVDFLLGLALYTALIIFTWMI